MIARPVEELGAQVQRVLIVRTDLDWSVPVEAELLLAVLRIRLNCARFMRPAIYAPDLAALGFRVNVIVIGGVLPHPKTVAAIHVFPTRVGDAAWIRRVTYP